MDVCGRGYGVDVKVDVKVDVTVDVTVDVKVGVGMALCIGRCQQIRGVQVREQEHAVLIP